MTTALRGQSEANDRWRTIGVFDLCLSQLGDAASELKNSKAELDALKAKHAELEAKASSTSDSAAEIAERFFAVVQR
jgi:hypothetical protein